MTANTNKDRLSSFAMFVLAASPLLHYYNMGSSKISILAALGFLIFIITAFRNKLKLSVLPKSYWMYWVWCTIQMYYIAGIAGWSDYLPGGILLCIFSILLLAMIPNFDYDKLFKYMRGIFIVASAILIIQYSAFYILGEKWFFIPPLTNDIGGFTIQELLERHTTSEGSGRFCSIFIEPSYFGQYSLVLLTMELFRHEVKDKLYSKFSLFIVLVLILLRSGTGLLGLLIVVMVKIFYILIVTKQLHYIFLLAVLVPAIYFATRYYLSTSMGAYVVGRASELNVDSENSSGYSRLFYGWQVFEELSLTQKILGTSRNVATEAYENGFSNMITYVVTSQGVIGLCLLAYFYIKMCVNKKIIHIALVIVLITIALIEACYLGGLMLIISVALISNNYSH